MTVIQPNSISGVTSITAQGGGINVFRADGTAGDLTINNIVGAAATFTGVLTYEDVANVDSVGVVTARTDINLGDSIIHIGDTNTKIRFPADDTITAETGGSERLRIDSSGRVGITSIIPASKFTVKGGSIFVGDSNMHGGSAGVIEYGGGSGHFDLKSYSMGGETTIRMFTSLNGTNSERLRINNRGAIGIGGANYGSSGQVLTSGGSGATVSWSTISGVSVANQANNRLITATGTTDALTGESSLLFDPPNLEVVTTNSSYGVLKLDGNSGGLIEFKDNGTRKWELYGATNFSFYDRANTKYGLVLKPGGNVEVSDGDLVIGTNGHGIDFSATGGPAEGSGTSELFDDYEEGSFTPVWKFSPTNATSVTYNIQNGKYVKIGGVVFIRIELQVSNKGSLPSGAGWAQIDGLPYACSEYSAVSIGIYQHFNNAQPGIAHVGTSEQVYIAYDPSLSSNTSSYDLQHTNFTNNSRINISGTYYAV